jgi:squalene-hopene/tetraprenyl-beta-curcumene cyclase
MDFLARLTAAYQTARQDLLAERNAQGHWTGELSASALSTATAISALVLIDRHGSDDTSAEVAPLIAGGIAWLGTQQNADGGFGDTDLSYSNISTTMLVQAAFHLAGLAEQHADLLQRAAQYVESKGGVEGLRRRYGKDKTFAVPILTNAALAGIVAWKEVSPLPFEAAWIPQSLYRFLGLPVVSYAIPALVAIGQAKFLKQPSWNPWALVRRAAIQPTLRVLQNIQPSSTDNTTRESSLRELVLARALYRCGDFEGLGEKILREYAKDLRGHYRRHAQAILNEKTEPSLDSGELETGSMK